MDGWMDAWWLFEKKKKNVNVNSWSSQIFPPHHTHTADSSIKCKALNQVNSVTEYEESDCVITDSAVQQ